MKAERKAALMVKTMKHGLENLALLLEFTVIKNSHAYIIGNVLMYIPLIIKEKIEKMFNKNIRKKVFVSLQIFFRVL